MVDGKTGGCRCRDAETIVSVEAVLSRLQKVRRNGTGHMACCPAHEDRDASLSISEGDDGRVLLHCHAGCETPDICARLNITMADLMPEKPSGNGSGKLDIIAEYDYTDEYSELLYQVVRISPKSFRQRRPEGEGWTWRLGDVQRVLYRLPAVLDAAEAGQTIYVVEGEKDVEALERADVVATCNSGGAGKWRDEYSAAFKGAEAVVVIADRDGPGRVHAAQVEASVKALKIPVLVLEAAEGKDASDHLAAGKTLDEFVPVAAQRADTGTLPGEVDADPLVHEAAHTAVLADAWRGCYRWAQHEGSWRRWDGHVWEKVAEPVVVAAAQKALREHYGRCLAGDASRAEYDRLRTLHIAACRYASVAAGLAFLKGEPGFHTESGQWDADAYLLNCADGLLDLRTQKVRPHDPTALCTKIMRWTYADETSTGAWQRHLERCLPSADVRRQVQRDLGRALVGADLEESLPIWFGTGANGKSTTEHAIQQGADGYGKKAVRNLLVASKFERHPTEIADLAGARIVFSEEVEDGKQLAEALVKDLTGGATQKARFMRCDNFEFEQTFSIFLLVNHRPVITGTDKGIWRRIRLVPWTVSIPLTEQRPQDEVVTELLADGSWMLRWMVAGFADWQADHHWIADEVKVATDAYRAEQDRLAGFLGEFCEEKRFAEVSAADLHAAYGSWCIAEGEEPLSKTALGKTLKSRGFTSKRASGGTRVWQGIRLLVTRSDTFPGSSLENASRENEAENTSLLVTMAPKGGDRR
jgi:putative DNA primase/helicase